MRMQLTRITSAMELVELEQKHLEMVFETLEPMALQSAHLYRRARRLEGELETAKMERDILRASSTAKDQRIATLKGDNASDLSVSTLLDVQKELRSAQHNVDVAIAEALRGTTCVACVERRACVLFMPCKHVALCDACAQTMREQRRVMFRCPICRSHADDTIKLYA